MANSSDQIQADIARNRARMSSQSDQSGRSYGPGSQPVAGQSYRPGSQSVAGQSYRPGSQPSAGRSYVPGSQPMAGRSYGPGSQGAQTDLSVEGIVGQMRQRPLLTLGLGLIAGSLLQDYLGGDETSSPSYELAPRPSYPTYTAQGASSPTYGRPVRQDVNTVRQGVSNAASTVGDAAQSAGNVVIDTASDVVDTARDAASAVVDTTVDVAQRVADTTVDVAYQAYETVGDVAEGAYERAGDLTSTITNFVSGSPLMALGISLAAGSLLQRYLRGGSTTARRAGTSYSSSYPAYPPTYGAYEGRDVYGRPGAPIRQAGRDVAYAVGDAADAVGDAAQATGRVVSNAAYQAVDTTVDAASAVADATVDVAQRAGNMAVDAADYVVDTASSAAGQVAETVSDLWPTITRQVQERPLATLGVATVAGMFLQPMLAPHVKAVTTDVNNLWNTVSGTVGDLTNLPEPVEVQRIKDAIVPATVDRTRQLITREGREYLDSSLSGVIGQASLRAGVVAAVTDKAEEFIGNRLPNFLNGLGGTSGLLLLGLAGAVLQARNQAQQGQGQTIANVRTQLSQSIVQNAQEQLSRFFPEFRDQLQSQQTANQQCPNCGSPITPSMRFCANCGRAVNQGASV